MSACRFASYVLDDAITSVISYSGLRQITSDPLRLQTAFWTLAGVAKSDWHESPIGGLLGALHFRDGLFPFSTQLESTLMRLEICGALCPMNPDWAALVITSVLEAPQSLSGIDLECARALGALLADLLQDHRV